MQNPEKRELLIRATNLTLCTLSAVSTVPCAFSLLTTDKTLHAKASRLAASFPSTSPCNSNRACSKTWHQIHREKTQTNPEVGFSRKEKEVARLMSFVLAEIAPQCK
jgi:hypothetical protein